MLRMRKRIICEITVPDLLLLGNVHCDTKSADVATSENTLKVFDIFADAA